MTDRGGMADGTGTVTRNRVDPSKREAVDSHRILDDHPDDECDEYCEEGNGVVANPGCVPHDNFATDY